ncbi:MAG: UDP-N-acetylmuramoyl-tripeptide--D-alanyl-D-alanine ligase [Ignavibacteriaceae bacterium]|nr:UDP-N-acetylmuramoyl-tripeptide--D-alanyl-D-alanine ligase [Ignavibacteriaceae bacterium]
MKQVSLTIQDFFQLSNAVLYDADKFKPITKVSIDSRNVSKGSLFIAIKGEKFDGHDFINEAIKKGANLVLINENKLNSFQHLKIPIITVKNTTLALGEIAAVWRKKLRTKIIGLTGSAGKTTTKEMIFNLLSEKYSVNKTAANNNNHIGVPLTLLSTTNKHDYLVLELGTNHFGEIKYSAEIALPDYALITNIGNSHLEFLNNKKGVLKEKSFLFEATKSINGTLLINNEDPLLRMKNENYKKRITFGIECNADVKGRIEKFTTDGKPVITVSYKGKSETFEIPFYGEQGAKNFLAAATVALTVGLRFKDIKKSIKKFKPVEKRLDIRKLKNFVIINDTYNANPESMKLSLELLAKISIYKNRIAILGDMFELGSKSKVLHEALSRVVLKNKIDRVYLIGKAMKYLHKKLINKKVESYHFENRESFKEFLIHECLTNSVILIKGSRGMKMEEFTESIISHYKGNSK